MYDTQELQDTEERRDHPPKNRALFLQTDPRRNTPVVKPARMHIPEFSRDDTDSWIQIIEQYFDAARTPLEQRTEIATTYLKGPAIQWWRSTGVQPTNLPWHRFCRLVSDRFAVASICDNIKTFHALTQKGSVAQYTLQFEHCTNLMRRDNPALTEDYYLNSYIAGLSDYIQNHLQCHKPRDM